MTTNLVGNRKGHTSAWPFLFGGEIFIFTDPLTKPKKCDTLHLYIINYRVLYYTDYTMRPTDGISRCDAMTEYDRLKMIGMIVEGISWRTIGREFNIPYSSIATWAKRNGYSQGNGAAKRAVFDSIMDKSNSGDTNKPTLTTGNESIDNSAASLAYIGSVATRVAKKLIERLDFLVSDSPTTKDCVAISTSLDKAWATVARINKLDDTPKEIITIEMVE